MKLSILIPTYNYDCSQLVQQLQQQLPENAEIIVGDDSPPHNLGRAARRNALAREAKGEWLLFIDADAQVRSSHFIADYLAASEQAQVVCGGTGNLPECPRAKARLRYDYEVKAEKRLTLAHRQKHPYIGFTTFNFLIERNLFLSILFDERLKEYGHEDTLFGLELKKRGINILHIDNKLTHLGLEDADEYLQKTEVALRSLAFMPLEQQENVRVSALALRLKRFYLQGFVRFVFKICKPLLRLNLLGKRPNQTLFAFYKLGYFVSQNQKARG